MQRLTHNKIAEYRQQQLTNQRHCCALCGEAIVDDAVLDHCHKTGLIRRVLHRGCNALLGKIENNLARNRMSATRLDVWAKNLTDYITKTHTDITHPTHKTLKEKQDAARKRIKNRKKQKAQKAA